MGHLQVTTRPIRRPTPEEGTRAEHVDRTYRANPATWGSDLAEQLTENATRRYGAWQANRRLFIRVKSRFLRHKLTLGTDH